MDDNQAKAYEWIKTAILSSNNPFHIECCKKLVELFISKYPQASMQEAELLLMTYEQENKINYI